MTKLSKVDAAKAAGVSRQTLEGVSQVLIYSPV